MSFLIPDLRCNRAGYQNLARLVSDVEASDASFVQLDFENCSFIEGSMCSALGAVIKRIQASSKNGELAHLRPEVKDFLKKNGFLEYFGTKLEPDTHQTTTKYKVFEPKDGRSFAEYLDENLRLQIKMSQAARKSILQNIMEIFNNCAIHSDTQLGIHSCGQFFPQKHRLTFTLTDLGIGIRKRFELAFERALTVEDSIQLAISGRSTAKRNGVPGGMGLKGLQDFMRLNGGCIQLVSENGFWEFGHQGTSSITSLTHSFPGTIVTLDFNTADEKEYVLGSEAR